jgi:hypothetical protein
VVLVLVITAVYCSVLPGLAGPPPTTLAASVAVTFVNADGQVALPREVGN